MKKISTENEHEEFSQHELALIDQIGIKAINYLHEAGIVIAENDRIDFCEILFEVLGDLIKEEGANAINSEEKKEILAYYFTVATVMAAEIIVAAGFSNN